VSLSEMLFAVPFMLAHEVSDFVFFATVAPVLYIAARKVALRQDTGLVSRHSTGPLETEHV